MASQSHNNNGDSQTSFHLRTMNIPNSGTMFQFMTFMIENIFYDVWHQIKLLFDF